MSLVSAAPIDTLSTYYEASQDEDMDKYYSTQLLEGKAQYDAQIRTQFVWDNFDTLSYELSNILITTTNDVDIIEYHLTAQIGGFEEDESYGTVTVDHDMVAILVNNKIYATMPAALFDARLEILSQELAESCEDCLVEEEKGFFAKLGEFFSKIITPITKTISGNNPPKIITNVVEDKSYCGDATCDENENYKSCRADCEPNFVCGDGICSQEEDEIKMCHGPCLPGIKDCGRKCFKVCEADCAKLQVEKEVKDEIKPVIKEEALIGECITTQDCPLLHICEDNSCIDVVCLEDIHCDDEDVSTTDTCVFPGNKHSRCLNDEIKKCRSRDDYCPPGCTYEDDKDCAKSNVTVGSGFEGGQITMAVSVMVGEFEDHNFFDFSRAETTTDFDQGDIFFNEFADIFGECVDSECVELKEENDDFEDMLLEDAPTSGWEGGYTEIEENTRYWIKLRNGDIAKIEVLDLDFDGGVLDKVTFNWAVEE